MRTHHRLILCIALAAAGCARKPVDQPPAASKAPVIGIDVAGLDKATAPGDDFDAYASGAWRAATEIPDDRSSVGTFYEVFTLAEQRQKELMDGILAAKPAAGTDQARIASYYSAFMDEAGIESRGIAPLKERLAQIDAIADRNKLAAQLGANLRADVDPLNNTNFHTTNLFGLFVAQGLDDPAHNVGYLLQGGLGMPDRDYYLSKDESMASLRAKYQQYIAQLFALAGITDPEGRARAVFELERRIAQTHASITDSQDIHKANNLWKPAEFTTRAPGLAWSEFFKAAGVDSQPVLDAWQPRAITGMSALVASEPLESWKSWLTFHLLDENTDFLPKAFDELGFGFHGTALQGTPQQRERWKRALAWVGEDLGDAVGKAYVAKYFPASSRERIQQLVANLIAVFPERIDRLDWMSAETKAKAKAKVATLKVGVGYPDSWRDYSRLEIRADDPMGNHERAQRDAYRSQLAKLATAPDQREWWLTPQTVNALNLPLQNSLNFPAGILEAPFFDPAADDAANYGSIGAVIGHEISHSFDNLGAEFDEQGRLRNWWTPADLRHFEAAGKALIAQYDAYEALPGLHLKGGQELGENIADLAGLAVAYDAYRKSLGGKEAPVIDGLSGDQRFFIAYGQSWREKRREASLRARVATDVHAPAGFRAQTVRNMDAWYAAFEVKPGQKLYLAPEKRVKVW
jgi:putative endopeptidase